MVGNYARYTADGTYWSGRKRGGHNVEVVRIAADGEYQVLESLGIYSRPGSAVAAAAKAAYAQGRHDAQVELGQKLNKALAEVGIGPMTVEQGDVEDEGLPVEE